MCDKIYHYDIDSIQNMQKNKKEYYQKINNKLKKFTAINYSTYPQV